MAKSQIEQRAVQFAQVKQKVFNPFPGLRPFGMEEAHLFFGREGQSDEILLKLAENRFVAALGFSGSGKSSLIFCGLIPILHGGFMTQAGSDWRVISMRPGNNPIDNLAESLVRQEIGYAELSEEDQMIRRAILSTILRSSSLGLIEAVRHIKTSSDENVLILVDQFEEIFRYKKTEAKGQVTDESSLFISLLLEAVQHKEGNVYVTLTMRSDFIGECSSYSELTDMINRSHYLIPQMNRDQKRSAIMGPVSVGGGKITPRLVQQLLNDIGESPDQLPVLQHALMRTWHYWTENRRKNEPIDLHHYVAIGTVKEALSQHANEAYDTLTRRQQSICESMFKALTEKGSENQGIRRPTKLSVMAAISGVSEDEIARIVERFREPGRSLLMPPREVVLSPETIVDISHESLMRVWNRLKTWLEEEAKSVEMYTKLAETAERHQRGVTGLMQMPDLQIALNWREENRPTPVWGRRYHPAFERTVLYLENSKRAYDTEQTNRERLRRRAVKRTRIVAIGLAFVAVGCVFLAYLSKTKADEATQKEAEAKLRQQEAVLAKEEADLAKEHAELNAAVAEREKLRAKEQAEIAEAQKKEAEAAQRAAQASERKAAEQAALAREAAKKAEEQAKIAEERQILAENAQMAADSLRYRAIAQSMASRVEDIRDIQQKSLIALQSYKFYEKYGDKDYNGDIYAGVFGAYSAIRGKRVNVLEGHAAGVRTMVTSSKGILYTGGADGKVYAWEKFPDEEEYQPLPVLDVAEQDVVIRALVLVEEKNLLMAVGDSPYVYFVNLNGGKPYQVNASMSHVYDADIFPDQDSYVLVGRNGLMVRGSISEKVNKVMGAHSVRVKKIDISEDGKWIAGGDEEGNVLLWNADTGDKSILYTMEEKAPIHAISFSNKGEYLSFGDETGKVVIWNMKTKEVFTDLNAHYSRVTHVTFDKEDRLMVSSSRDKTAKIWDMHNINDLPIVLEAHQGWVHMAGFDPQGKQVFTVSQDADVRVWPTGSGKMIGPFCQTATRNLSQKEWLQYVGEGIGYEITCEEYSSGSE
ncbi:MAG: High-affnity carbon uptake protein Hat/HatR [Cytophagales bacterium]|nr:High-affnity carbon uptake protein Hat/HatR [Cytophagales bacterium]